MTTPIEPEVQTEEEEVTIETPVTPTPNIDEIKTSYNQLFQDQQAEIRRLQAQVSAPPAPVQRDLEQDKQLLFDDPRRLLREEIAEQNKPIMDFMNSFQRQQSIDMFKSQMRNDAMGRFKYLDKVSDFFDRAVQGLNIVNADSVVAAYNLALGNYVSNGGNLIENTAPSIPPANPNVPIPPHIRPAAPIREVSSRATKPVLTEAERKIARINNMSDEDFVKFRDMPASQVAIPEAK